MIPARRPDLTFRLQWVVFGFAVLVLAFALGDSLYGRHEDTKYREQDRLLAAPKSYKPGPGGSVSLLLTPLELIERLAALIPPPRRHRHRYCRRLRETGSCSAGACGERRYGH